MLFTSSESKRQVGGNLLTQALMIIGFVPVIIMTFIHVIISSDIFSLPIIALWIIPLVLMLGYLLATLLALMDNGMCVEMFGTYELTEEQEMKLLARDRGSTIMVASINTVTSALVFLAWVAYWASNMNVTSNDIEGITQYHITAYGWLNALAAALYGIGAVAYPIGIYGAYIRDSSMRMSSKASQGKKISV